MDPKEYFHHCVAALRAAVSPESVSRTALPYREAFGDRFVQGSVASLDVPGKKVSSSAFACLIGSILEDISIPEIREYIPGSSGGRPGG